MKVASLIRSVVKKAVLEVDMEMMSAALKDYLEHVDKDWNYILPTQLYEMLESGETNKFFIVDLRDSGDYVKGHIKGATNIFWLDILKPEKLAMLPVDKTILLYCYVGHTSSQVMVILRLMGYHAMSLKFGLGISPVVGVPMAGWVDYNYPLV